MSAHSRLGLVGTTAAIVAVGAVVIGSGIAPAKTSNAAPKKITAAGVDGVKLGALHADLRAAGLVGPIRRGCPLGLNTRSARLKAPLKGNVDYTTSKPRTVVNISIRGGARARGVGVGSRLSAIRAAFPKARVFKGTEQVFGIWLVRVPKNGGGKIQFAVDVQTKRATLVGVPFIAFCE